MIYAVDDVPENLEILSELLAGEGHEVRCFSDPLEAWEATAAAPPELLLLDVVMPGLDGITFCRRVKADLAAAFVPVVLITAVGDREKRFEGLRAGADEFVAKPFDRTELLVKVRNLLHSKTLYDRLRGTLAQLDEEMALAGEVQHNLFIPPAREVGGFDCQILYFPAQYLSGDVIDLTPVEEGGLLAFVADVSGHGVVASLLACAVKILFGEISRTTHEPEQIMKRMNQAVCSLLAKDVSGSYVTAVCCRLTAESVVIASAGHPPPLLWDSRGVHSPAEAGLPLGIRSDEAFPGVRYANDGFRRLMAYTDGLLGAVRLDEADLAAGTEQVTSLQALLQREHALGQLRDDVTVLLIAHERMERS